MPHKGPRSLDALKKKVRKLLPARIAGAVESYDGFVTGDAPADAKGFAAYHAACKAAIGHVEMLFKLAKLTEAKTEKAKVPAEDIEAMVREAEAALSGGNRADG